MKKVLSLVLALLMVVSMMAVIASAADPAPAPTVSKFTGTADHSWYVDIEATKAQNNGQLVKKAGAGDGGNEYTISTADQFWSFMEISNGMAKIDNVPYTAYEHFTGEIIKLAIDVVINEGDADEWWEATEYSSANGVDTMTKANVQYMWTPISMSHKFEKVTNAPAADGEQFYHVAIQNDCYFAGTFDGQGHSISGVYSLLSRQNGFFGKVTNGNVKNFSVVNSVFYNFGSKYSNNNETPSKVNDNQGASQGCGLIERLDGNSTVSGVYTDAYFRGGWCTGGIVAYLQGTNTTIENCVFNGTVDGSTGKSGFSCGLLVGGDDNNNKHYIRNCVVSGKLILGYDVMSWQTNQNLADCKANGTGLVIGNWKNTEITNVTVTGTFDICEGRNATQFSLMGWDNSKGGIAKNVVVVTNSTEYKLNANTSGTGTISDCYVIENLDASNQADLLAAAQAAAKAAADKAAADAAAAKAAADKALADEKAAAADAAKKAADELAAVKAELEAAKAEAPAADDTAEEKGCKSVVAAGAILVTVSALGLGAVVAKKKED